MGYQKPIEIDELPLPSDNAYVVRMKRRASFGDQRAAQSAMIKVNGQTGQVSDPEYSAYIGALLPRLIVSWNLTDENDQPLPVTAASLDLLEAEDGRFLVSEATKRTGSGGVAQSGPFATPSATASEATPSPTPTP